jgi:DNA-binding MarR family transcriptional regulator
LSIPKDGLMSATEPSIAPTEETLRDLPPSAKLVVKVLEYHDRLTQSELASETLLPPRTVRYALSRLEDVGAVESRFSFADARKRLYSLRVD